MVAQQLLTSYSSKDGRDRPPGRCFQQLDFCVLFFQDTLTALDLKKL
jgi:hypothetical protein